MKTRLYEALILVVSITASFLLCEAVIRHLPVSDAMGWTMVRPVAERVAAAGPKPSDRPRIVVVGDSFTEWRDTSGQSFPRVAQRRLEDAGKPVDVVNLAESGTGLREYFGNLARYADVLRPDIVVVGLYLGNDMVPALQPLSTQQGAAAAQVPLPSGDSHGYWWHLAKKSVALNYAYRLGKAHIPALRSHFFDDLVTMMQASEHRDDAFVARRLAAVDPTLVDAARADTINGWDLAGAMFFSTYYGDLARLTPGTRQGDDARSALNDLDALVRLAREHQRKVVVVLLPPPVWVGERYQDYFRRLGYSDMGPVSGPVPLIELVARHLTAEGIATVDTLPRLRAAPEATYLPRDEHLNRDGQRVVGDALAETLLHSGLLER